jgi:transcriptional regulator with XRE-family HTH domain
MSSVGNETGSVENMAERVNVLFGQQLAAARRVRRISQTELANRISRSRITIANLESGRQNVQLHQVFALAKALDVPASELIPDSVTVLQDPQIEISDVFVQLSKSKLQSMLGGSK